MRARWLAAVTAFLVIGSGASADVIEANLKVVGRWALGTPGAYGDVTIAGTTAVVAGGSECGGPATILDVRDPQRPRLTASIAPPEGTRVADLDSATLLTPNFTGDLLAVVLSSCGGGPGGSVAYYDITDPAAPRALAATAGASAISLAQRIDGRAVAVRATAGGAIVEDISDPAAPAGVGTWPAPAPVSGCHPVGVQLYEDGERALAVVAGGVYDVDLIEPSQPTAAGPAAGGGGPVAVLALGNRTVGLVAEDGTCPPGEPGLRIFTLVPGEVPLDEAPLRYAGAGRPGRLVASGGYAYVAWGEAGLRVVDFAEVRAKTVAQFVPAGGDVVGVGLLPEHVVVTDAAQGLFVLERPDEGGERATFWTQFLELLPYLGGAVILTAVMLVPRLVGGHARAGSPVTVPGAEPVRRRRA